MTSCKGKSKFHGIASLALMFAAFAIGVAATAKHSAPYAWLGGAVSVVWLLPVAWFFCAKCAGRLDCGHVLPGLLTRLLPKRDPGPYTGAEKLFALLPIIIAVAYPQYWLAKEPPLLAVFWILAGIGGLEARAFVCRGCANSYCPFKSKGVSNYDA